MSHNDHFGHGHILNIGRDLQGPLHIHQAPNPQPVYIREAPAPQSAYEYGYDSGGGAGSAIGFAVVLLLVVAGGVFAFRWFDNDTDQPSGRRTSTGQPHRTTAGDRGTGGNREASSSRKAASYPIRITYQHWFQFIPQSVDLRVGDSLRFSNSSGRSCHLIASSGYLPSGTGDNPTPDGGSYTVKFTKDGLQNVRCEEEPASGVTVVVDG